jgi:hypothetical protein
MLAVVGGFARARRVLLALVAGISFLVASGLTLFVSLDFWPFDTEPTLVVDVPSLTPAAQPVLASLPLVLEEIVVPPYELAAEVLAQIIRAGDAQNVAETPSTELFVLAVTTSLLSSGNAFRPVAVAWIVPETKKSVSRRSEQPKSDPFASRTYQASDQNNSTVLSLEEWKTSVGWCVLKPYMPCFMPEGYGREIVIREKASDRVAP